MKNSLITFYTLMLLGFIFASALCNLHAQTTEVTKEDLIEVARGQSVPEFQATEVEGSPYLYTTFQEGHVTLFNGTITEPFSMNFNTYENRIEFSSGENVLAIEGDRIRQFSFLNQNGDINFAKGYSARGLNNDEFVQILVEGPMTVLIKYDTAFQENVTTYGTATQKDEYISNTRLYIHKEGKTERVRRMRERLILRTFDTRRNEMRDFSRENNLDLSELDDIKLLFEYYNRTI